MLRALGIVVGLLAVAVGAIFAYAATLPPDFRIERSTVINAPADQIHPLVNDFKAWPAWSPWEKKDPDMKRTYSEPSSGEGAKYSWSGDSEVGVGEMVIAQSEVPSRVKFDMLFKEPMEAQSTAEFTLSPQGDGTKVTWAMYGKNALLSRVFCMFMDMDKMVGTEFEKGLAAMKAKAEGNG